MKSENSRAGGRGVWHGVLGGLVAVLLAVAMPAYAQSLTKCDPTKACCRENPIGGDPKCAGAGNPIDVVTGNKYQREEDLPALPGLLGIEIVRHYNSAYSRPSDGNGLIGRGWRLSYEVDLVDLGNRITIVQADGTPVDFTKGMLEPQAYGGVDPANGRVSVSTNGRERQYVWQQLNGRQLGFDGRGKLTHIKLPSGEFVSLLRDPRGMLQKVTDPQGRSLVFHYLDSKSAKTADRFRGIQAIDTPVGRFEYEYGRASAQAKGEEAAVVSSLVKVTYPGQDATKRTSRLYHYEDKRFPTLLTGITVQGTGTDGKATNERIATYGYDAQGRGNLTVKGVPAKYKLGTDGKPLQPLQAEPGTGIEQVTLDFSQAGKTIATNSLGQQTVFTYRNIAGRDRLVEARGAGCAHCPGPNERYDYDNFGRVTKTTRIDARGHPVVTLAVEMDSYGRPRSVEQQTYLDGKPKAPVRLVRYDYAEPFKDVSDPTMPTLIVRPSVVQGESHVVRIRYNKFGQPVAITEEGRSPTNRDGHAQATRITRESQYAYATINGRSVLVRADGPLPNGPRGDGYDSDVTSYVYDARGDKLLKIAYPLGLTVDLSYDEAGRVSRHVGVDRVVTEIRYAPDGRISHIDRAGAVTRLEHDASGRLASMLDPLGQSLRLHYDSSSRLVAVSDLQSNRIALERNTEGNLVRARLLDPEGTVSQQHDYQQSKADLDPVLAGVSRLVRAADDDLVRPRLPQSPASLLTDIVQSSIEPVGQGTEGFTKTAVDALGRITAYYVDDFRRTVGIMSPVTGYTRYVYNDAGQLVSRTQADGSVAKYERDAAGRVTSIKAVDAAGRVDEQATVAWSSSNRPERVTYLAGEESFQYDGAGRLTRHSQRVDSQEFVVTYRYDEAGRLIEKRLPSGKTLSYRYRGSVHPRAGLLESVWLSGLIDRPIVEDLNSATDRYRSRSFRFGNGLGNETHLDSHGRITKAGNGQVGQTSITYRAPLASTQAADQPQVEQTRSVLLSERAVSKAERRFSSSLYGAASQWLLSPQAFAESSAPAVAAFSARDESTVADYDSLGRRVTRGGIRFVYDSLNRLTEVRDGSVAGDDDAGVRARYRYNLFGQRIAKVVYGTASGSRTAKATYFFHDGSELLAEAEADGIGGQRATILPSVEYLHINGKPVAAFQPGRLGSTSLYFVHTDHRNAPLAVTSEDRRVLWQGTVEDFGQTRVAAGHTLRFNLRASNQYFDEETGLHYNTNRYFDPAARRYLTPDPLGLAAGPDLYAFALNRPHEFSDPLGLQPIKTDADVAGASLAAKIEYVFGVAARAYPGALGEALLEMVSPANLATTAAIFAVWAAAQATPVGWAADIVLLGIGYFLLGEAIATVLDTLVTTSIQVYSAKCIKDLDEAGGKLGKGLADASAAIGSGLAAGGAPKIAKIIRDLMKKAPVGKVPPPPPAAKAPPPPPPPPPATLNSLKGRQLFGPQLSRVGPVRNDGELGEQIAKQVLEAQTGGVYRGIHNASNNGPDLIRINHATRTIEHVEVKSCQESA